MFNSKNKIMYDLILSKLNENTQDVVFSGNYMFKFVQQLNGGVNFSIVTMGDALDFTTTQYVPLVDVQSIQIPFVEKNERDDWEREFYVAIEMPKSKHALTNEMVLEFDESNAQYQAVLETLETMRENLTFVDGDYKFTFKVKEPTKVDVFTYNKMKYQILSLTFNLTSIKSGFFGNETKAYLGLKSDTSFGETDDYLLDTVELTEIVSKTVRATSNVSDTEEVYTTDKRMYESNMTINFNGNIADMLIYKEKAVIADIKTTYQIKITNKNLNTLAGENLDYTIDVFITSVNISYRNNVVDQITFKLERA